MGEGQAGAGTVAGRLDEVFGEVVEHRVVDEALEAVVDVDGVVALVVADQRGGAGTDEGGVVDHRSGVGGVVTDGAVDAVPLAAVVVGGAHAVGEEGILDGEPELVGAGEAFVDVEGVVLVEGHDHVAGADGAAEELDAVVGVGIDFDVVDFGAGADAAEGEAVDLAAGSVNVAAVADGDVAEDTAVVGRDGAAVFDHVGATVEVEVGGGGGLEAFDAAFADVGGTAVVGDGAGTEDDDATPAAGGGGSRGLGDEGVTVDVGLRFRLELVDGGEDDGLFGGAVGVDLGAAGDDEGAEGIVVVGRSALVVEGGVDLGAGLDGEGGAVGDEDLVGEDVDLVLGPGGVGGDGVHVGTEGGGVDRLGGDHIDLVGEVACGVELGPACGPVLRAEGTTEGGADGSTALQRGTVGDEQRGAAGRTGIDALELKRRGALVGGVERVDAAGRVAVDRSAGTVEEGVGGTGAVEVGQVAARRSAAESADGVVGEGQAGARAVAGGLDELLAEVVEQRVVDEALEAVVDVDGVVALVVADQRGGAGTDEGGVVDHRSGVGGVVTDGAVDAVPLAAVVVGGAHAVGEEGILDGEPELVGAGEAFVDVEGVVLVEGHDHVAGADGAAEELDAVVGVGIDFDVVDFGAGADAAEGEAVDLAAGSVNVAAVADGDVAEDTAVVGRDGAAVFDHVGATVEVEVGGGGGLEAFDAAFADVGGTAVVGDGAGTEDDDATPAAGGGGSRGLGDEGVTVDVGLRFRLELVDGGEDDGLFGGAVGVDLGAAGDDEGAEGIVVVGRSALVVEGGVDLGAGLDGQRGAVGDEDLVGKDVDVVLGPGGVGGDGVHVGAEGGGVHRLGGDDVDLRGMHRAGHHCGERQQGSFRGRCRFHRCSTRMIVVRIGRAPMLSRAAAGSPAGHACRSVFLCRF